VVEECTRNGAGQPGAGACFDRRTNACRTRWFTGDPDPVNSAKRLGIGLRKTGRLVARCAQNTTSRAAPAVAPRFRIVPLMPALHIATMMGNRHGRIMIRPTPAGTPRRRLLTSRHRGKKPDERYGEYPAARATFSLFSLHCHTKIIRLKKRRYCENKCGRCQILHYSNVMPSAPAICAPLRAALLTAAC